MSKPQSKSRHISANIAYYLDMHCMTKTDLAGRIMISRAALSRKFADPERFTVREIERISRVFKIDPVELLKPR